MSGTAKNKTLEDIAKLAGVSTASVSRALNGSDKIKEETKKRILDVVNQNNYALNYGAQSLSKQKSNAIALYLPIFSNLAAEIAPIVSDPFFLKVLSGIMSESNILKSDLVISTYDSENPEEVFQALSSKKVGGVVVFGDNAALWKKGFDCSIKYPVVFWGGDQTNNFLRVASDNVKGGEIVADTFLNKGVKNPAYIGGNKEGNASVKRLEGFRSKLKENGVKIKESNISFGSFSSQSGVDQMNSLIKQDPTIDAVFACSDVLAQSAIKVIQSNNLNVPKDIKVIGFDNIDSSATCVPALTTVSQDGFHIGRTMVKKVIEAMNDLENVNMYQNISIELIQRESC